MTQASRRPAANVGPDRGAPATTRWYLVHAQTGRERVAEENLRRQGYRTFLPTAARTVRHARKLTTKESAYFPGYLFVSLDPAAQAWRPINGTLGVVRLYATDSGGPAPVPRGVVEALLALADKTGRLPLAQNLTVGDSVTLVAGPFTDARGTVRDLIGPDRIRVLLAIMDGEVIVDVPRLAADRAAE
ncbi:MAG TPA: transcriptional activator RfaH [Caulobacteraceae bacterium]|jgi:transcriptional antiterminator RfaH